MRRVVTEERQDGSHIVLRGKLGRFRAGDIIPADVAKKLQNGEQVDIGRNLTGIIYRTDQ